MIFLPRSPLRSLALPAAALLVAALSLHAQAQDLSGAWDMDMSADLPEEAPGLVFAPQQAADCVYAGDCQMSQDGSDLSGTVDLTLVSGPAECPPEMTATLDGSVAGDAVTGTLSGPQGAATFEGSEDNSFSGTFAVTQGDEFLGTTGEWLAQRPVEPIPALTGAGLTLLVLALLAGGAWALRRERRPA